MEERKQTHVIFCFFSRSFQLISNILAFKRSEAHSTWTPFIQRTHRTTVSWTQHTTDWHILLIMSEEGSFRRESSRPCSSLNKVSLMFNHFIVDVEPQIWDKTPSWCCDTMHAVLCQASLPPLLSSLIHPVSMWLTPRSGLICLSRLT